MTTEDGKPHPDVQICIMNACCIALVAQERERWPLADDNLFIDIDLRPDNLPPRQPAARLAPQDRNGRDRNHLYRP